jgi:ribonuclease D
LIEAATVWIDDNAQLERNLTLYDSRQAVVLDTEFVRERTYFPKPALVQLGAAGHICLVDPLALSDASALKRLLGSEHTLKVVHSGSEDLEVFQSWLGSPIRGWFDTQVAAALLGYGHAIGYRTIVETLVGEALDKGETRSDWLQRPLSESQLQYAVADVFYLEPVFERLHREATGLRRVDWVLEEGARAVAGAQGISYDCRTKIGSAWKLSARGLFALTRLSDVREQLAIAQNKPRGWILDDQSMMQVAMALPSSKSQLRSLLSDKSRGAIRHSDAWLVAVEQAQDCSEEHLPNALRPPPSASQRQTMKHMKQRVSQWAQELSVAPEIVFNKNDYALWLQWLEGSEITLPDHWMGWRHELFTGPLMHEMRRG